MSCTRVRIILLYFTCYCFFCFFGFWFFADVVDNLFCGNNMDSRLVVSAKNLKFDRNNCNIVTIIGVSTSDIVWIRLQDGTTSISEYDSYSGFTLQTSLMIESGSSLARIYFCTIEIEPYHGTSYYVALKLSNGDIFIGYNYYETRVELERTSDFDIQYSQIYSIKIEVDEYFCSVFNSGSIGLRTWDVVSEFYKMNIIEWTSLNDDIECYSHKSAWFDGRTGCYVTATCDNDYTMTDCSRYGFWNKHGGAQIGDNVCYAYTQSNTKGVKASIRCCKGMSSSGVYDIERRNDWDANPNNDFMHPGTPNTVIATCGDLNKNSELIGCDRLGLIDKIHIYIMQVIMMIHKDSNQI